MRRLEMYLTHTRERWWLYIDMDAFYAEVERRDHPEWKTRPVIVGGSPAGVNKGVVASATYEVRKYGIRAGLPIIYARRLCPDAVYVTPDFQKYTEASEQLYRLLLRFSPDVEQASIDEAFVDLTYIARGRDHPRALAQTVRSAIERELHLPCTMGLACTRLIARIAGKCAKPRGFLWIPHGQEVDFLRPLPVDAIPGIGSRTLAKLGAHNIWTIGDLQRCPSSLLKTIFGGRWWVYPLLARGEDPPRVTEEVPWPKSMGREVTLPVTTADWQVILGIIFWLLEEVTWRMRRLNVMSDTVIVRWRYPDLETYGYEYRLPFPTHYTQDIYPLIRKKIRQLIRVPPPLRLIGIRFARLQPASPTAPLLEPYRNRHQKARQLQNAIDSIRKKYGFFKVMGGEMARWLLRSPEFHPHLSPLADWMMEHHEDLLEQTQSWAEKKRSSNITRAPFRTIFQRLS